MASGQTANYNLNQWEAGDQVLRTEFNEDNQKIDGALAGKISRELILEEIISENVQTVTLDLTGVNWGEYQIVSLHIIPSESYNASLTLSTVSDVTNNTVNHIKLSDTAHSWSSGLGEGSLDEPTVMYLFPLGSNSNFVQALSFGYNTFSYGRHSGPRFNQVHSFTVTSKDNRYPVPTGTKIQMFGIR